MSISCGLCGAGASSCLHHRHHHEYQFLSSQGHHHHHHHHHGAAASAWLYLDNPLPLPLPPPPANFHHRRSWIMPFHEPAAAGNISSRLTLEVDAGGRHMAHLLQPPVPPRVTTMPICGGAFTSTFSNGAFMTIDTEMMVGAAYHPTMQEREAKVMRYREKWKRRRYDNQVRYESRKAYAELRPRVNGRFVKVPEDTVFPSPPASPYDPSKLHLGWSR